MVDAEDGIPNRVSCWMAAVRTHYFVLLVTALLIYLPRLLLAYFVFILAQLLRAVGRIVGVATGRKVNNRRILIITDYMPPQTHGIAIRCHAYIKEMRSQGHEVVCFTTAYDSTKETSFDHCNIPSLPNPFNLKNRVGYNAGVKLAWYLGAYTYDVVHLVCPSLITIFVLTCCNWRRIPVYCSHHVEMDMFSSKHTPWPIDKFGIFMYSFLCKWPAALWATLNAAPTLCFARAHIGKDHERTLRCVPSGTHDTFRVEPDAGSDAASERRELRQQWFGVDDEETKVTIMVQRLSGEKGTERIFPAFLPKKEGGQGINGVLAICGDGPSKDALMAEASSLNLPVVFLGNVPHHDLPKLYRAADCFVTMSLSETFGLTCLEAQMCGCPCVMPHCDVFDEIWSKRVPKSWWYNIESSSELAASIKSAMESGRQYLKEHPVNQTWKLASQELLKHYEECISINEPLRRERASLVIILNHCARVMIVAAMAGLVFSKFYFPVARKLHDRIVM